MRKLPQTIGDECMEVSKEMELLDKMDIFSFQWHDWEAEKVSKVSSTLTHGTNIEVQGPLKGMVPGKYPG